VLLGGSRGWRLPPIFLLDAHEYLAPSRRKAPASEGGRLAQSKAASGAKAQLKMERLRRD
jgi:hypothetical protein